MGKPSRYRLALGHMGNARSRPEHNVTRRATNILAKEERTSRRRVVKRLKRARIRQRLEAWKLAG